MKCSYITPSITLLGEDGRVDLDAQARFLDRLVEGGVDGILVQGSIGEFFAIPMDQRRELARAAIDAIGHRVECLIGTCSMVPEEIVPYSRYCLENGADGVMIISPYYFRLDQASIFRFYDRLFTEIEGPVYIYNFPDRTGYCIAPDTVARLAERHPNLRGIKDTLVEVAHTRDVINATKDRFPDFLTYSGFDDNAAHNVLSGGAGVIGGLSNVAPEVCSAWMRAIRENDLKGVAEGQQRINRLMDIYFVGPMFVPIIKEAARMRGLASSSRCTFPIPEVDEGQQKAIRAILEREGLL